MKTSEILNLDCTKEENKKIIQKALRKIKPFSHIPLETEIPLVMLEILISKYQNKYGLKINYINPVFKKGELNVFSTRVINKDGVFMKNIYGNTIYELFSKLCIYFFCKTKEVRND